MSAVGNGDKDTETKNHGANNDAIEEAGRGWGFSDTGLMSRNVGDSK